MLSYIQSHRLELLMLVITIVTAIIAFLSYHLELLSLVIAIGTAIIAFTIPRRIMVNQMYNDLLREYRGTEMGAAILGVFHFYTHDCGNDPARIPAEYEAKYKKQIEERLDNGEHIDFTQTLHFQRRLVAQFYADFAELYFNRNARVWQKKEMHDWFTDSELNLLNIILHMVKPASAVFLLPKNLTEPPKDNDTAEMNKRIRKLYEEVKKIRSKT